MDAMGPADREAAVSERIFLSLGAGVQSSTLYLMACNGEFDQHPDAAIFADTGWEPKEVYLHLEWLKQQGDIPIHTVSAGNIRDDATISVATGSRFASLPFHGVLNGAEIMLRRQCTREYKVAPITKTIRVLLGYKPRQRIPIGAADVWIGISTDEVARCKPNWEKWITNKWPLIDFGMSRADCLAWMEQHGYRRPPKSACIGCPYHDDATWRDMKLNRPHDFQDAVDFERTVHDGLKAVKGKLYLHRSLQFLDEIDFRNMEDLGQLNMFNNECEGYCGV